MFYILLYLSQDMYYNTCMFYIHYTCHETCMFYMLLYLSLDMYVLYTICHKICICLIYWLSLYMYMFNVLFVIHVCSTYCLSLYMHMFYVLFVIIHVYVLYTIFHNTCICSVYCFHNTCICSIYFCRLLTAKFCFFIFTCYKTYTYNLSKCFHFINCL